MWLWELPNIIQFFISLDTYCRDNHNSLNQLISLSIAYVYGKFLKIQLLQSYIIVVNKINKILISYPVEFN